MIYAYDYIYTYIYIYQIIDNMANIKQDTFSTLTHFNHTIFISFIITVIIWWQVNLFYDIQICLTVKWYEVSKKKSIFFSPSFVILSFGQIKATGCSIYNNYIILLSQCLMQRLKKKCWMWVDINYQKKTEMKIIGILVKTVQTKQTP